jgi:transcriptional regulator with PAS, ATPase and Fis domain
MQYDWTTEFSGAITVCDREGIIVAMNDKARSTFSGDLVGKNVLDCHPEPARTTLKRLLETGGSNIYTVEKQGKTKLIHQSPWYRDGQPAGLVELALELPSPMPHRKRD